MSTAAAYAKLFQRNYEFRLFNPWSESKEGSYNGHLYTIPPATETWIDPTTKEPWGEPGVLPIRGYEDTQMRELGQKVKVYVTAQEIVEHLVGPDGVTGKLGLAGIRLLIPDGDLDGANDAIRREAKETADKKKYEDAQATIRAFDSENAKRIEHKQAVRQPNVREREAFKSVAQMDSAGGPSSNPYSCPRCFEGFKNEAAIREHISAIHKTQEASLLEGVGLKPQIAPIPDPPQTQTIRPVREARP